VEHGLQCRSPPQQAGQSPAWQMLQTHTSAISNNLSSLQQQATTSSQLQTHLHPHCGASTRVDHLHPHQAAVALTEREAAGACGE